MEAENRTDSIHTEEYTERRGVGGATTPPGRGGLRRYNVASDRRKHGAHICKHIVGHLVYKSLRALESCIEYYPFCSLDFLETKYQNMPC